MHGVVSLLDDAHSRLVEDVWAELKRDLGLAGVYVTPYPHFSYHVAASYDAARLEPQLAEIAAGTDPFEVAVAGLGVFAGPAPVLYIGVVRSAALAALHGCLWSALTGRGLASGALDYYAPEAWMPHITLAVGDLDGERLAEAMRRLGRRSFDWRSRVDNLAYIEDRGAQQRLRWRMRLGA